SGVQIYSDKLARPKMLCLMLVIAALLVGILAPTPTMQQYPFAIVPFLVLAMVYALSSAPKWAEFAMIVPLIGALWTARADAIALRTLAHPAMWVPVQV